MSLNHIFYRLSLFAGSLLSAGSAHAQAVPDCDETQVPLMQKLGTKDCIDIEPGVGTFLAYFNDSTQFIFAVAVGAVVVWVLVCGFAIMLMGGDAGKRGEWIENMKWSIGGLLLLLFAGFILRTLNSMFFK